VFADITSRWADHYRSRVHPLFAAIVFPPVFVLDRIVGLETWDAVRVVLSCFAGLWTAMLFAALRLLSGRRLDALVFTSLGVFAAGTMFWMPMPETHPVGSLTILFALLLVVGTRHRRVPEWVDVFVSASTLSVTVTNWMAGIAAASVRRPPLRAAQITANAFVLVTVLWVAEKRFIPSTVFFLGQSEGGEMLSVEARGPLAVARSLFVHTIVMPAIQVVDRPSSGDWPIMVTQASGLGSGGPLGGTATILWGLLLLGGLVALVTNGDSLRLRVFLALTIAGHWLLFTLYGTETFLYSPLMVPLLVTVAALAAVGSHRRPALVVACLLSVLLAINNGAQWQRAVRFFDQYEAFEHSPARAQLAWPEGPWPGVVPQSHVRTVGGGRQRDAGRGDPSGNFSLGFGELNISVWRLGDDGAPIERTESFSESSPPSSPATPTREPGWDGIDSQSDFFTGSWRRQADRAWTFSVEPRSGATVALVLRSVGLNPGPIRSLSWRSGGLIINERWVLTADDATRVTAHLVSERDRDWTVARPGHTELRVTSGWAAARLEVSGEGQLSFFLEDRFPLEPLDRTLRVLHGGVTKP
jgi:hypothetical protein